MKIMKKRIDGKKSESVENLLILKIFYSKIIDILDNICACSSCDTEGTGLNAIYTSLVKSTRLFLKKCNNLKKFEAKEPILPSNLLGEMESFTLEWKNGLREEAYKFIGDIEEAIANHNSKDHKILSVGLVQTKKYLSTADKAIRRFISLNGLKDSDKKKFLPKGNSF